VIHEQPAANSLFQADRNPHDSRMLEFEEALKRILEAVPAPVSERVALAEAHGRVLTEQVLAPIDLPGFDNSAMDGYAVRAAEVALAGRASPVRLRLAGRVEAGQTFAGELASGTCVRIFTGSPLPPGADAVVMQEDTEPEQSEILIQEAVKPWENIRFRGEDVKCGAPLIASGEILTAGRLGLLAAVGSSHVLVSGQPVVGVLATGSELKEPGKPLEPGQIYESNRIALAELTRRAGGKPKIFPLIPDVLAETRAALADAFNQCDMVVTSGGVSVGEMDFVKRAVEESGGDVQFWKVAIKPGRPFVLGRCQGKLLFGLPGNPVSALVTFLLLVRPALLGWQGARELRLPFHNGKLAEALANPGERRHFMRVKMMADGSICSAGIQASHVLSATAAANGLVDVPPRTTLPQGSSVQVWRWD